MAIEWFSAVSTLAGTTLGWCLTRASDRFKLRSDRDRRGREFAAQAMDAVMILEDCWPGVVFPRSGLPEPEAEAGGEEALRVLYRMSYYIPEPSVRQQLQLAHRVLRSAPEVSQWGNHDLGMPRQVVNKMCREIKQVLGAYLREEKIGARTKLMEEFGKAYDIAMDELAHQYDEQAAYERKRQREERELSRGEREQAMGDDQAAPGSIDDDPDGART